MKKNDGGNLDTNDVLGILLKGDRKEEEKLYNWLSGGKKHFIAGVVRKISRVPLNTQLLMAEEAFNDAYIEAQRNAHKMAKDSSLVIKTENFERYFYGIFKNCYYRLLFKELRRLMIQEIFKDTQLFGDNKTANEAFSDLALKAMVGMSGGCGQLLRWYYLDGFGYDRIAALRQGEISESSAPKMVSRCKQKFIDHWKQIMEGYGA
ncbi:MAG TPA: hypothetical protein VG738_19595 [Chitinophagaceae bacterium]|nr:hypothetical protein [Chitinophagaceae bacterium]